MRFAAGHTPWNKGKGGYRNPPLSAEAKERIRQCHLGMKASDEARLHMSEAHTGKTLSEETKDKLRAASTGNHHAAGMPPNRTSFAEGHVPWNKGKPHLAGERHPNWKGGKAKCKHCGVPLRKKKSVMCRACYQQHVLKAARGDKHHNWKGGITPHVMKIRTSPEYKAWRNAVFQRDDFTCVICGKRGGKLEADHILPFATHPDLRLDVTNGRTLCQACHRQTDTYLGKCRRKARKEAA